MRQIKIKIRVSTLVVIYMAVILTMIRCDMAKADEARAMQKAPLDQQTSTPLPPVSDKKVTEDILANSIKAEWPSDKWKVVPKEEICVPPAPCGKKNEPTTGTLHEKMKYECPTCRKCVKEIAQIKKLKEDISEYLAEIERLKKQLQEEQDKLTEVKPPVVAERRVDVPDDKKNFLYFSPMYTQDGIIATNQEGEYVYEAKPVQSVLFGGGYTRFFEFSKGLDLGLGLGGYIGQNNYAIDAQIGVKF